MTESRGGDDVVIRSYQAGDEHAILPVFNAVFREVCGPTYVDRDLAYWRWQFLANPFGHRIVVAVAPDGSVAAHYGGVVAPLATEFGDQTLAQAVDSFVHPQWRQGLRRMGVFVRTARPWFELCRERGDVLTFGYPVATAERIGKKLVDYQMLGTVDYLVRDLESAPRAASVAVAVAPIAELGAEFDALFARLRGEKRLWTRRDAALWRWRYQQAPGAPYQLLAARRGGALCGAAVLRVQHELVPNSCTIADWLAPAADVEVHDALIAAAERAGCAAGRKVLLAVFPDWSAEHAALLRRGFTVVPSARYLERRLAYRAFHPALTADWLRQHWWFTLGDSDLV